MPPHSPAPFVVGAPRSGTTLLRLMLDAHPRIAIPAESHFYPALLAVDERRQDWLDAALAAVTESPGWGDYRMDALAFARAARDARPAGIGDVLRTFYASYAARFGKPAWGDKFPGNVLNMTAIARLLPEARFVHIVRDGRDVAASLRGRWWRPEGDTFRACIELWAGRVRAARAQAAEGIPYIEVRYEALVRDPRATLARVCAFVEIPYDDAMLRYAERAPARHGELTDWRFEGRVIPRAQVLTDYAETERPLTQERIGRWRAEMSAADVAACEQAAGAVLAELGYLEETRG